MLGSVIKKIRELKGISQSSFATQCGISKIYLAKIENNERNPNSNLLKLISKELEIPLSILIFLSYDDPHIVKESDYQKLSAVAGAYLLSLVKDELEVTD